MAATIDISDGLFHQTQTLAQRLNIPPSRLVELALEQFMLDHRPDEPTPAPPNPRIINQGDVYWVELDGTTEAETGIPHPHVIIQDNLFNHSRIHTVVACALTSNIKRASLPGNVLLEAGEANLPRHSVVEASKISTVDKAHLGEYIGSLSEERVSQILSGIRFLQTSYFPR